MSLVRPRPCPPNQEKLIHDRGTRGVFAIRPGITGLTQINDVDKSIPRKLARYDSLLVKNLGLSLYLALICATLSGKGLGERVKNRQTQGLLS
jgi:O-antigen biosynthesis protein WbqP